MNAKDILMRAIQSDKAGRILEAQDCYQYGIPIIMYIVSDETDPAKKQFYHERIKEFIDRMKQIQQRVRRHTQTGAVVANIQIDEDSTGHSYNSLFGKCMNSEVKEILLVEPHLGKRFQIQNLIVFLELVVKKCSGLKYIRIVTKEDSKNPNEQLSNLKQIKDDLRLREINVNVQFDPKLHDRKIILSNGYIIKSGRGLDIFKATDTLYSLGLCDYDFRKCRQTDVDIWLTKAIS